MEMEMGMWMWVVLCCIVLVLVLVLFAGQVSRLKTQDRHKRIRDAGQMLVPASSCFV